MAALSEFDIDTAIDGDIAELRLSGDLDISAAPRLIARVRDLAGEPVRLVKVNCERVEFLDSAGVRALMVSRNEAVSHDAALRVVRPSTPVRRVLDMTGLAPLLAS